MSKEKLIRKKLLHNNFVFKDSELEDHHYEFTVGEDIIKILSNSDISGILLRGLSGRQPEIYVLDSKTVVIDE